MLTATISYVELAWTLISLAGFVIVSWLLWRSIGNRFYLEAIDSERIRANPEADPNYYELESMIAAQHVLSKSVFCVTMLVFILIGIVAMTREPSGPNGQTAVTSYVAAAGFISVVVLMTVVSAVELRREYRMIELIKKRERMR